MISKAKHIRISPKKANLVAEMVRMQKVNDALTLLKFTPKKAAPLLSKVIESAVANAEHNFKQKRDALYIKEIIVTKGPTLKRIRPVSRGRAHPILKKTSHITVQVGVDETAPAKETPKKTEAKKSTEDKK